MISVIIPTLNTGRQLGACLAPLIAGVAEGVIKEAIVADGGSSDETLAIADASGCAIVAATPPRAAQFIAGAKAARGEWLLFLWPQSVLAHGWLEETQRFLARPGAARKAAAFKLAYEDERPVWLQRLRAQWFKHLEGAQGLLIARSLYDEIGGYREVVREDLDIAKRIGAKRIALFEREAIVSASR